MTSRDRLWVTGLLVAALLVWLRDRTWITSASEVLPILAALPLFAWLGAPWTWRSDSGPLARGLLFLGTGLALAGVALDFSLFLAMAWTVFLWSWLSTRLEPLGRRRAQRLLVLPLLAFPWLALDGGSLGWWFRLSGAWTAGNLFQLAGLSVTRAGTHLLVQGLPISVDASCAGLKVLQALLIAGTAVAFLKLGDRPSYWWSLPALVALAWLANTSRVVFLSAAALTVSPEFAQGWFHAWGGWFVLMLMFGLSTLTFSWWRNATAQPA